MFDELFPKSKFLIEVYFLIFVFDCSENTFLTYITLSLVSTALYIMTELLEGYYKAVDHFYKFMKVWSQRKRKVLLSLLSRSRTGRERRMTGPGPSIE